METPKLTRELTHYFYNLERQGLSLYMLTLMFSFVRGSPDSILMQLNQRTKIMWDSTLRGIYNNPKSSGCRGIVFWDWGNGNDNNKGLHAHCIIGINEHKMKGKCGDSFLRYWKLNATNYLDRGRDDPLKRSHLQRFDGMEKGIDYCCKSGQGLNWMLVLGVEEERQVA